MSEQSSRQAPDFMELWRQWLTQSERQINAASNEAMGTEAFARAVGGYMEMYALFQRMLTEAMQRYLTMINVPSRNDVIGLGEKLSGIEDRLARIEETLRIAIDVGGTDDRGPAPVSEPMRTRRPPGVPAAQHNGPDQSTIPEELRRS